MRSISDIFVLICVRLLPIDKKCVYVYNILDGFNDSVKYIVCELHKRHPEYKIVWDSSQSINTADFPSYITLVKRGSVEASYYQMRAMLCLDSYLGIHAWMYKKESIRDRLFAELKLRLLKKSRQLHISTFHGVPYWC